METEGSGNETVDIVLNKIILVHYSNTTAENILAGTESVHASNVLKCAD